MRMMKNKLSGITSLRELRRVQCDNEVARRAVGKRVEDGIEGLLLMSGTVLFKRYLSAGAKYCAEMLFSGFK